MPFLQQRDSRFMAGGRILKKRVALFIFTVILFPFTVSASGTGKGNKMEKEIRMPSVAGQFYSGDAIKLRSEIEQMLSNASGTRVTGKITALVSPHAGYMYSGQVAAFGYSLLEPGQFSTVIVVSPCHIDHFPFSSVYTGTGYETPLGIIPIDRELAELLIQEHELIRDDTRGHVYPSGGRGEHSLEVQLPFLQVALENFKLVPVVMGDQSGHVIKALGEAIGRIIQGRNVLIVASTDLSHFHPDVEAKRLDNIFIDALVKFDPSKLLALLSSGDTEACGGGPVAAAMIAAKESGTGHCKILEYANSGSITGDRGSVVGYVSAVFLSDSGEDAEKDPETDQSASPEGDLSLEDRIFLLGFARKVIETKFTDYDYDIDTPSSPVLKEKRGGFVTLKKNGQLRGCIGYIEAIKPLIDTIAEMAESAAFNDYRFASLEAGELDDITIEISVLSPIRQITDPSEIIVGKHGIIITRGSHRGLLLPQVATEWKWDRDTFLSQTCVKAGLDPGAWKKEGTRIEIFSAEIFSEEKLGLR